MGFLNHETRRQISYIHIERGTFAAITENIFRVVVVMVSFGFLVFHNAAYAGLIVLGLVFAGMSRLFR